MSTEIYYFSGTGNSLAVARDIAEKTSGKLISIASLMDKETLKIDAEVIGMVFPIYYAPYGGVPLIVRRFINKLENINSKYIFAICTYGSGPFNSLKFLDKLIESRGGKLGAGFMVNMPNNMARSTINSKQKQQKMFHVWKENMETVYKHINVRKEGKFDLPNIIVGKAFILIKIIFTPLMFLFKPLTLNSLKRYSSSSSRSYEEILPLMDNSFYTDENCIGCSNCSRICPVKNIKIVDGRLNGSITANFASHAFTGVEKGQLKAVN